MEQLVLLPGGQWTYSDPVQDLIATDGGFCYYVEAFEVGNPSGIEAYSRSNEACAEDQFCTRQHVCQKREGCATSSDCNDPMLFCDIASGACRQYRDVALPFDPTQFETRQVFVTSKDGTRVPAFIVAKKGIVLDGNNPTPVSYTHLTLPTIALV